jgi:hypothetical protein
VQALISLLQRIYVQALKQQSTFGGVGEIPGLKQLWLHSYHHPSSTVGDGTGVGATQQPRGTMWEGSSNKPPGPLRSRVAGKKCCYPGLYHPSKPKPKLASRGAGFNISTATNICSSSQATINLWRCGRNPRSEAALAALLSSPIVHCGRWYRSGGYTTTKGDNVGGLLQQAPRASEI